MARFRDKIVHHYFGIEFETVWNTAKTELPKVLSELEQIPELIEVRQKMMAKQFANLVFSLPVLLNRKNRKKNCGGNCVSWDIADVWLSNPPLMSIGYK